jgi:CheY-like chemotaxis protein
MASVLVVDDSVPAVEVLETLLSEAGHQVMISTSGKRAIQLLRRQAVDLIITDIYMPEEDGLELIRSARGICPQTPVIAMSGMTGVRSMLLVAERLGACCSLQKPFSNAQLLQAVNTALCNRGLKVRQSGPVVDADPRKDLG